MRISRIQIENFRNFVSLDVRLSENAVIVGENKIGKSNLLYALRLILDPSLPDSARKLREEDFWDGLGRPLGDTDRITISVELADFEDDENKLTVLAEHLIESDPMVSKLTYVWQPIPGLEDGPKKDSDYEFFVYGGDKPENHIKHQVRQRLPMELIPALRDCESDLARWTRSPLKPLLDKAAGEIESTSQDALQEIADEIDETTDKLTKIKEINSVAKSISDKLIDMVGSAQALETMLRFSPTDANRLIRALRIYIDGGVRSISDASLGSANLLYFALKTLEYDQMVAEGDRDHTFLAIEEPEAHLHPNLQRLIFRNFLKQRGPESDGASEHSSTVLMTTHSPHIASVTPLKDFVVLRHSKDINATEAVSTAEIALEDNDIDDLERYIDVNRGEVLFAKGIILVEGDAERFLLPVLAKKQGFDLDELGISVCSIAGTNFYPYLMFFGNQGINLPVASLTDYDPRKPEKDGTPREPLGPDRVLNQMMYALVDTETWENNDGDKLLSMATQKGIFINTHTFEVDLFQSGLSREFAKTMTEVGTSKPMKKRMQSWADNADTLNISAFLKDIESVGKGRFAQRLAGVILKADTTACPDYIKRGLQYVTDRCK